MVRYLSLISYTQQGAAEIKASPGRAKDFSSRIEAAGGKVVDMYWSLGEFDGVLIFDAPDDQTGTALLLKLAQLGNVRTNTMQVFNEEEFSTIVGKV